MAPGFRIRGLGEIAIRCRDFRAMCAFYGDILGLEPLVGGHRTGIRFFRIADGVAGHTAVLALFDGGTDIPTGGTGSSLHHLALSLPRAEQDAVTAWYDRHGITWEVQEFGWIGWRGIFAHDPDGNTVELVAFDPGL